VAGAAGLVKGLPCPSLGAACGLRAACPCCRSSKGRGLELALPALLCDGRKESRALERRLQRLRRLAPWTRAGGACAVSCALAAAPTPASLALPPQVLGQSVFVYTHTGELKRLPKGSTVVDFAYTIHTQLGNEMGFAKVNGRVVNAQYTLKNGEVVEVRRACRRRLGRACPLRPVAAAAGAEDTEKHCGLFRHVVWSLRGSAAAAACCAPPPPPPGPAPGGQWGRAGPALQPRRRAAPARLATLRPPVQRCRPPRPAPTPAPTDPCRHPCPPR
jgi:hypothetical protein